MPGANRHRVRGTTVQSVRAADRDGDGLDECRAARWRCRGHPDQDDLDADGIGDACHDDEDGDGVPDTLDNCPAVRNPHQTDDDDDGLGNACDESPEELAPQGGLHCATGALPPTWLLALAGLVGAVRRRR